VPDPRLGPYSLVCKIKSVRVKDYPVLGKVVDLHWKGKDSDLGIISRLNSDISIRDPIMRSDDVLIRARGDHRCWIISTKTRDVLDAPSEEMWSCYQAIARHLLAEWSPG